LETYLRDEVTGCHFSWNRTGSEKGLQRNDLTSSSSGLEKIARVGPMVVAALVVEACSKKKGKVNRPSGLKVILLGCYTTFGPKGQESRVCFGIVGCNTVNR